MNILICDSLLPPEAAATPLARQPQLAFDPKVSVRQMQGSARGGNVLLAGLECRPDVDEMPPARIELAHAV
jgi:hypothetical protein